jgi:hypothetical protein
MGLERFPVRAIWAVLLFSAVLMLAPSFAQAHAGHSHSRSTVAVHHVHAPSAAEKASLGSRSLTETQSVSAASQQTAPAHHQECDGQGCCTSGPCTGYHGFVLTTTAFAMPSMFSTLLVAPEALPPGGAYLGRLRRPPKSFA